MVQDGQAFSLANYTNNTINSPSNDEEAEMWIVRNGNGSTDLAGENLNSIINFKCGKTLKRRTLRQTLQRKREEQKRLAQQVTQKKPGVEGNGSAPGRGPVGHGERLQPARRSPPACLGHRLSYTEATGGQMYSPPSYRTVTHSATINNPVYMDKSAEDNYV